MAYEEERKSVISQELEMQDSWVGRKRDCSWSYVSQCQACQLEEGTEKHRLYHCPGWYEIRWEIPETCRKCEQQVKSSRREWKWQRGVVEHPLRESQWTRVQFRLGFGEDQQLGHARFQRSRCHGRLSSGYSWKVVCMWLVSGAIGF